MKKMKKKWSKYFHFINVGPFSALVSAVDQCTGDRRYIKEVIFFYTGIITKKLFLTDTIKKYIYIFLGSTNIYIRNIDRFFDSSNDFQSTM